MALPERLSNLNLNRELQDSQIFTPAPTIPGTICLLIGIIAAFILFPSQPTPATMATIASQSIGIAFLVSLFLDYQKGLRNLLRTDLLCLVGIYALTLAEFLFPQEALDRLSNPTETALALRMVFLGIGGLAIGRHLIAPKPMKMKALNLKDLSDNSLFWIVIVCTLLGFASKLIAVKFKIFGDNSLIYHMMEARFTQPWGRSRLGGISSLFTELALLVYAIPPLSGVIINRWKKFPKAQFISVLCCFSLTMFSGFAGGTRNVFIAYLMTFLMGYLMTLKKNTIINTVIPIVFCVWLIGFASYHMLEFRTMGLRRYLEYQIYASDKVRETIEIDNNLASMGLVAINVPKNHGYIGAELLIWSVVKPIPRVFWPGKPEGLSVSVEEIVGAGGWTVAVTYVGEAYLVAGFPGIVAISMFFGALAAWWNRMAASSQTDYGLVVYALGFFAAGLTMRSMVWLTTAILPVIALVLFRKYASLK